MCVERDRKRDDMIVLASGVFTALLSLFTILWS